MFDWVTISLLDVTPGQAYSLEAWAGALCFLRGEWELRGGVME